MMGKRFIFVLLMSIVTTNFCAESSTSSGHSMALPSKKAQRRRPLSSQDGSSRFSKAPVCEPSCYEPVRGEWIESSSYVPAPSTSNDRRVMLVGASENKREKIKFTFGPFSARELEGVSEYTVTVKMAAINRVSGKTLFEHFKEDFECGLPWVLGLYYKKNVSAPHCADGRTLHQQMSKNKKKHELRSASYFSVEDMGSQLLKVEFIGTENDVESIGLKGILLQCLLSPKQNLDTWQSIGKSYLRLESYEKAIWWLHKALAESTPEHKGWGELNHMLGESYFKIKNWTCALKYLGVAQKKFLEGGDLYQTVNLIGAVHEQRGEVRQACIHYVWALSRFPGDMSALVNLFCLWGDYQEICLPIAGREIQEFARTFILRFQDKDTGKFAQQNSERCLKAYHEASRFTLG